MNGRRKKHLIFIMLLSGAILGGCGNKNQDSHSQKRAEVAVMETDDTTTEIQTEEQKEETTTEEQSETEAETEAETEIITTEALEETTTVQEQATAAINRSKISFSNSAFLGDSRTEGLKVYGVVSDADFYTSVGITVKDVMEKKKFLLQDGTYGTMLDAVSQKNYDRIYLMFGINELGWPYKESFVNYYTTIVNTLKEKFPNTDIYIQSILPMVEKRTDEIYNNDKIRLFNTYIKEVADSTGVNYIDVGVAVADSIGALPENGSNDGIHLNKEYCFIWAEYLKEQTIK